MRTNGDIFKAGLSSFRFAIPSILVAGFSFKIGVAVDLIQEQNRRLDRVGNRRPHGGREFEDKGLASGSRIFIRHDLLVSIMRPRIPCDKRPWRRWCEWPPAPSLKSALERFQAVKQELQ